MFIAATIAVSSTGSIALASDAVKIGGINLQYILDNTVAGKEALAKLKVRAEKETIILQKKQDAVKHLESELQQQRMMMRESTLTEKESNLRRMKRELELFQQDTRELLQQGQGKVMRALLKDIMRIIKDYAAKNEYTMIIEMGGGANLLGSIVLYMDKAVDLTSTVIKLYDEEFTSDKGKAENKK